MSAHSTKKEFAVIGLGRFGSSLARALVERGHSVLGIDHKPEITQRHAEQLTQVVTLDATDEDALRAVDIASFDTVVVAIGDNFENNLMTTVALKSIGVKHIVCKTLTERQKTILLRVGADHVVLPEHEAGRRLANVLTGPGVLDQFELEDGFSITELRVPQSMVGQRLVDTHLRQRFGVTVLVVKREKTLTVSPSPEFVFNKNDLLVVIGANADIARLNELA